MTLYARLSSKVEFVVKFLFYHVSHSRCDLFYSKSAWRCVICLICGIGWCLRHVLTAFQYIWFLYWHYLPPLWSKITMVIIYMNICVYMCQRLGIEEIILSPYVGMYIIQDIHCIPQILFKWGIFILYVSYVEDWSMFQVSFNIFVFCRGHICIQRQWKS